MLATAAGVDDSPEIDYWRYRFWKQFPQLNKQLFVFERMGDDSTAPVFYDPAGPHAYVHSKLVLVDDHAVSIGTVNLNRRSWYYDSEITAVVTDAPESVRDVRIAIWNRHLVGDGRVLGPGEDLRDPMAALSVWEKAHSHARLGGFVRPLTFSAAPARFSASPQGILLGSAPSLVPLVGPDLNIHVDIDKLMDMVHFAFFDPKDSGR